MAVVELVERTQAEAPAASDEGKGGKKAKGDEAKPEKKSKKAAAG
jgi:hypothetical protein